MDRLPDPESDDDEDADRVIIIESYEQEGTRPKLVCVDKLAVCPSDNEYQSLFNCTWLEHATDLSRCSECELLTAMGAERGLAQDVGLVKCDKHFKESS